MVYFYLIHNLPWGEDLGHGKRNVRTLFFGALLYILTHTFLWSSLGARFRLFRNYLFWILAADIVTMAVIYKMNYGETILREIGWYSAEEKANERGVPITAYTSRASSSSDINSFSGETTAATAGPGNRTTAATATARPTVTATPTTATAIPATPTTAATPATPEPIASGQEGLYCIRRPDGARECYADTPEDVSTGREEEILPPIPTIGYEENNEYVEHLEPGLSIEEQDGDETFEPLLHVPGMGIKITEEAEVSQEQTQETDEADDPEDQVFQILDQDQDLIGLEPDMGKPCPRITTISEE